MINEDLIVRLQWHAGLDERPSADTASLASSTWPVDRPAGDIEPALADCLSTLASLNREVNATTSSSEYLPRSLVYAVTEVVRMLRERQEHARDEREARVFARAAWRVEAAWSAVLAGDIEDVLEHLKEEEAARFE